MRTLLPLLAVCLSASLFGGNTPLPATEDILKAVKARQEAMEPLKERVIYTETQRLRLSEDAKVTDQVDAYEVIRVGKRTLRRQILKAGKPLTEKEAAKQDVKLLKEAEEAEKAASPESFKNLKIRDINEVCEWDPTREEEGQYILSFHPKKAFKPKNKTEEFASKLSGVLRVDAKTYDLLTLQGRTEGKISVALGLGALYEGAEFRMVQGRQEGGVMLPQEIEFKGSARMLWKHVDLNLLTTFGDFKTTGMDSAEITDVKVIEKPETPS